MLTDLDKMPFGQHKGKAMQDVPVEYLHWFWTNGKHYSGDGFEVYEYIKKSLSALRMENRDLIW